MGGSGAPSGGFRGGTGEKPSGGFGGPGGNGDSSGMSGGASGGTDSSSYHMASFDYAYNCVAVMEWLFQQSKLRLFLGGIEKPMLFDSLLISSEFEVLCG